MRLPRILASYLLRESLAPYLLALLVFTFILLTSRILQLTEAVVGRGVPLGEMLSLFGFTLPYFLNFTMPMSLLLGILLGVGRLASQGEVTAMRAGGLSPGQMLAPVALLAVPTFVLSLAISLWALPRANDAFRVQVLRIAQTRALAAVREGEFNEIAPGLTAYVARVDRARGEMSGILLWDARTSGSVAEKKGAPGLSAVVLAERGRILGNPDAGVLTLDLDQGEVHLAGAAEAKAPYRHAEFDRYEMTLDLAPAAHGRAKGDEEMTQGELDQAIASGAPDPGSPGGYRVVWHKRYAIPFACLLFPLLGLPLAIRSGGGRARGFVTALAVFFGYYVFLTGGEALARRGLVPAGPAMWSGNALFAPLALLLFLRSPRPGG